MGLRIGHLALLSGFCGIAYEILFMRLLSTFLGEMFYVGAAVLATFLVAFGLGALYAWRLMRLLWVFEIGIGLYAAALVTLLYARPVQTLELLAPIAGQGPVPLLATVAAMLLVPAAMVGFSVPMFTLYAAGSGAPSKAFNAVYAAYNVGAAACVLGLEYLLLRALGIESTVLVLAAVNLLIGLLVRRQPAPAPAPRTAAFAVPWRIAAALMLASVASGIWQLLLFKFAEQVFGPFHENFSLVVALGLVGLFAGTLLAGRVRWSAAAWMAGGAVAVAASFAAANATITAWAWLNEELGMIRGAAFVLKPIILALLGGGPLVVFGAAIPVALRSLPQDGAPAAGRLLALSSFANVAGYLAVVFLLYERLDFGGVAGIVCLLLLGSAALFLAAPYRARVLAASAAGVAALWALFPARPLLEYGNDNLRSLSQLRAAQSEFTGVETLKRFDNRVDVLRTRSSQEIVYINGYQTVATVESGRTNFREVVFGVTPALYTRSPDDALVLGLGTGITAGATAQVFRRTTAVEINPAVFAMLPRFGEHNFDIVRNPRAELVLKDAITALTQTSRRYDAIINTVTSPLYFSSSKLYTREFFALAASRLKPGGVYVLWFDSRVGDAGTRIIFETLRQSFQECDLVYISSGYLQVVCGNHRLAPQRLAEGALPERLLKLFREEAPGFEPSEFLLSLVFPDNTIHRARWPAPANTLSRPALEFSMAQAALGPAAVVSPLSLAGVDPRRSALQEAVLEDDRLARRCLALRVLSHSGECYEAMQQLLSPAQLGDYAGSVLALQDRRGPLQREEAFAMVQLIVERLRAEDAALVEGWLDRLVPQSIGSAIDLGYRHRAALLRARHRALTGRPVPDALVSELALGGPMEPAAIEVLAYAAAQRGDKGAAAERLRLLAWHGLSPEFLAGLRQRLGIGGAK